MKKILLGPGPKTIVHLYPLSFQITSFISGAPLHGKKNKKKKETSKEVRNEPKSDRRPRRAVGAGPAFRSVLTCGSARDLGPRALGAVRPGPHLEAPRQLPQCRPRRVPISFASSPRRGARPEPAAPTRPASAS
jgi:hypothetical protein